MRSGEPRRVSLSSPSARDLPELLTLARESRALHRPWVYLPQTPSAWRPYLRSARRGAVIASLVRRRDTGELVGVVNLSEVVRGVFQSAYLSFYAHAAHARRGFLSEALRDVVRRAFHLHRLHRIEANIQPDNRASRSLVQRLGFRREGFSERYLKIGGRWRDHERWALTRETWLSRARRTR